MSDLSSNSLAELVMDALRRKEYSSSKSIYQGIVVKNDDPEKMGRCRIRVMGVYGDDISDEDLPWALPDNLFSGSVKGSMIIPPVGGAVNVYFENDDLYLPKYTTKVIQKNSMSNGWDENYPDTLTFFETDDGDYFRINRKTMTCNFKHASGVEITIDKDGNVEVDSSMKTGTFDLKVGGNVNVSSVTGDININSAIGKSINLITGEGMSAIWEPNVIPVCPFTGLPHSISGMTGIKTLKGNE